MYLAYGGLLINGAMEKEIELLYSIIKNNLNSLESIEIIPYEIDDKSDYFPFYLINNNLGIPKNLVKKLFSQVLKKLLSDSVDELLIYSTCMLIINPGWYPIWGIRNKLISSKLINIKDELSLNYLLLNSNYGNKINQLWYYRLNLVAQLASEESIKLKEFEIFYKFTSQNSRNYYYWNYLLQLGFSFSEFQEIYNKFLKLFLSNPFELGGFNCLLHYSICHFNSNKHFLLTLIESYPNLLALYPNNECIWSGYFLLLSSVKNNNQLADVQQVLIKQLTSLKTDKFNHIGEYWKFKCEMVFCSYESENQYKTLKNMLKIKQSGHK